MPSPCRQGTGCSYTHCRDTAWPVLSGRDWEAANRTQLHPFILSGPPHLWRIFQQAAVNRHQLLCTSQATQRGSKAKQEVELGGSCSHLTCLFLSALFLLLLIFSLTMTGFLELETHPNNVKKGKILVIVSYLALSI